MTKKLIVALMFAALRTVSWSDTVDCTRYYFGDNKTGSVNASIDFITIEGQTNSFLYGFSHGKEVTFVCHPEAALTNVEHHYSVKGYYVSEWQIDESWQGNVVGLPPLSGAGDVYQAHHLCDPTNTYAETGNSLTITLDWYYSDLQLVPRLKEMEYSLAYDANGGEFDGNEPQKKEYKYGTLVAANPYACVRSGYHQVGWNTSKFGSGAKVALGAEVNGETLQVSEHGQTVTLYAQWEKSLLPLKLQLGEGIAKIWYKVSSDTDWKSVTTNAEVGVRYNSTWEAKAEAKAGYTCSSEITKMEMGLAGATYNPSATPNKITVIYEGNGATGGSMENSEFEYNRLGQLAPCGYSRAYTVTFNWNFDHGDTSAKSEYTLSHWNSQADGAGAYTYSPTASVTNPGGSTGGEVKLYAQWRAIPVQLATPSREGYAFAGWYAGLNGQTKVGEANDWFIPVSNTTLYAKWVLNRYTVSFCDAHPEAANAVIKLQAVAYGDKATPPTPPRHSGWSFTGWNPSDYSKVTSNLTVYALYDRDEHPFYRVRYNSNYTKGQEPKASESEECGPEAGVMLRSAEELEFSAPTGYAFLGWATNVQESTVRYVAGDEIAYAELSEYALEDGAMNLYAVWEPIRYTIVFNTGTNGVLGTMMPLTNCVYDQVYLVPDCAYTNYTSRGFSAWRLQDGKELQEGQAISNLTTAADGMVMLYADWEDAGELSAAIGLTNAVLECEQLESGDVRWAVVNDGDNGEDLESHLPYLKLSINNDAYKNLEDYTLATTVFGAGTLTFSWYYESYSENYGQTFKVYVDGAEMGEQSMEAEWIRGELPIEGASSHTIEWRVNGEINSGVERDLLCIDDILWTPKAASGYDWPGYTLIYADTRGAAPQQPLPLKYAATNETFELAALNDVEGFVFAGWSLPSIEQGTTGDLTIKARWRSVEVKHKVVFALAGGERVGGGALVQSVGDGEAAVAPAVVADVGFQFEGWDAPLENITSNLTIHAVISTNEYSVVFDGVTNRCHYGETVTHSVAAEKVLAGGEVRLVCVGWTGAGCVPGSGATNEVSFIVTGDGAITWNYLTNYLVSISYADDGGEVKVFDPKGCQCPTNEFWAPAFSHYRLVAIPGESWQFSKWEAVKAGGPVPTLVEGFWILGVTAPVSLRAIFDHPDSKVAFELAEGLERTGGGALSQNVKYGEAAVAPEVEVLEKGLRFAGWDADFSRVISNLTVHAVATAETYEVRFELGEHLQLESGVLTQAVEYGKSAVAPQVKAEEGYQFEGWDASFESVTSDLTVHARSKLTHLKVAVEVRGAGTVKGGGTLVEIGKTMTLTASAGVDSVFSGWWISGQEECLSQVPTYSLTVNATNANIIAKFIAKSNDWAQVECSNIAEEYERGKAIDPIDIKATGGSLPTTKVTGLPAGLKFKDGKIGGTPTKSGISTVSVQVTTAGKATAATNFPLVVRSSLEQVVRLGLAPSEGVARGKVTGAGVYAVGKRVTIKATANKGFVFSQWEEDGAFVSQAASYSFVMGGVDRTLVAKFIPAEEDAKSVNINLDGIGLVYESEPSGFTTNVWAGVYLTWPLEVAAKSATKVQVSGLPSGLKFTAKDIMKKGSKTEVDIPANTIYGAPTAGGKISKVKITVTPGSKVKVITTFMLEVAPLPPALVGTYSGGSTNDPIGSVSVTLAKTGKISGKWTSEGTNWTIAAASLDKYDPQAESFFAMATMKNGKNIQELPLAFRVDRAVNLGMVESELFEGWFVNWKIEPYKGLAAEMKNTQFTYEEDGVALTGKVTASGGVTLAGTFVVGEGKKYTASVKSTLLPDGEGEDEYRVFVNFPAKAAKGFSGWAAWLSLCWNEENKCWCFEE